MSTIVVLGAGELGGALAQQVAAADIAGHIVLVDEAVAVAEGKALDIQQAAPLQGSSTRVSGAGDIAAVVGAWAVVLADRYGRALGEWREDDGLRLVDRVNGFNQSAMILCAGAGQTTIVERGVTELGLSRTRLFGSAPEALRNAVIGLAALEAGCAPADVSLSVLGRPPDRILVPWETASLAGQSAAAVLAPPALTRLDARIARLWPPGPLSLAAAAARVLAAAMQRSPRVLAALVALTRDEGRAGRGAMLPVQASRGGIAHILRPQLTPRDRVRVDVTLGA